MSDYERLERVRAYSGLSYRALAKELGLSSPQSFYDIKSGKVKISERLSSMIQEKFNINKRWLLTGEGQMLNEAKPEQERDLNIVPLLPVYAQGGSLAEFSIAVQDNECEKIISPIKGAELAISVSGDSMYPEYPNGSYVFLKKINDKAFIEWGRTFVLDTCNGSIIKKVFPGKEVGSILCKSINPEYKEFEVKMEDIYGMYRVLLMMALK